MENNKDTKCADIPDVDQTVVMAPGQRLNGNV